jgi:hypothetical protein
LSDEDFSKIVKVEFAFNNGSVQELLKERGSALKQTRFTEDEKTVCGKKCWVKVQKAFGCRAVDEIENDINNMMKNKDKIKDITSPTLCFVTFEHHEAQHLCYLLGKQQTKKGHYLGKFWCVCCGCASKENSELTFPFEIFNEEEVKDIEKAKEE